VTTAEMAELNGAIEVANNSRSIRSAEQDLDEAIDKFKKARRKGKAEAITLSGTITVKNSRGQPFPFVHIMPLFGNTQQGGGFYWHQDACRLTSPSNSPWSIIIKKSDLSFALTSNPSISDEIRFIVQGYADDSWDYFDLQWLFMIEKEDIVENYSGNDISNIDIVLNTITLNGTISSRHNKPIPYVQLSALITDTDNFHNSRKGNAYFMN
jgi:hypothetical protein